MTISPGLYSIMTLYPALITLSLVSAFRFSRSFTALTALALISNAASLVLLAVAIKPFLSVSATESAARTCLALLSQFQVQLVACSTRRRVLKVETTYVTILYDATFATAALRALAKTSSCHTY